MSSPTAVPSKAAIHALRGLIFGTSCSIVLLAEERRRRITIARAAVENGRKIKSLKRYSTAGGAAVEALQEEAATDPNCVSWSTSSRIRTLRKHNATNRQHPYQFDHSHHDDLGPDPRAPRATLEKHASDSTKVSSRDVSDSTHAIPTRAESKPTSQVRRSRGLEGPGALPPIRPIQVPLSKRTGVLRGRKKRAAAITAALEEFWASPARPSSVDDSLIELGLHPEHQHGNPGTTKVAFDMATRAYESVKHQKVLPPWFTELSRLLSAACRSADDFRTAGKVLAILVQHGPMSQSDYLAHDPFRIVDAMLQNTKSLMPSEAEERLELSTQLLFAELSDDNACRTDAWPVALAYKAIEELFLKKDREGAVKAFRQTQKRCSLSVVNLERFIQQLRQHNHHFEAVDAFVGLANLPNNSLRISRNLCENIGQSVLAAGGYCAPEVVRTMRLLTDDFIVDGRWALRVLETPWTISKNYQLARDLFKELRQSAGGDDIRALSVRMIQISLEANDLATAQTELRQLSARFPDAQSDLDVVGSFIRFHAAAERWDAAWILLDRQCRLMPFDEQQQIKYDIACRGVIKQFSETHTWGETEFFVQRCVESLKITVDRFLVNMLAHRHAKCRDFEALGLWLQFCRQAGFCLCQSFWEPLLADCKNKWGYDRARLLALHQEVSCHLDIEKEWPGAKDCIRSLPNEQQKHTRQFTVRTPAKQLRPTDERMVFERMKADAHGKQWHSVVQCYRRAVHHGMGFSSRCLRLAVQATIETHNGSTTSASSMIKNAQNDGHDVSSAIVPMIMAQMERIRTEEQDKQDVSRDFAQQADGVDSLPRGHAFWRFQGIFERLRADGLRIDDEVFDKAARVCGKLRNYRESISICVSAAETHGSGDLCYNVWNFCNLGRAFTARHDYEKLRWLLGQLEKREYRTSTPCIKTLKWMSHYLRICIQQDKNRAFVNSDSAMLKTVNGVLDGLRAAKTQSDSDLVGKQSASAAANSETESRGVTPLASGPPAQEDAFSRILQLRVDDKPSGKSRTVTQTRADGVKAGKSRESGDERGWSPQSAELDSMWDDV